SCVGSSPGSNLRTTGSLPSRCPRPPPGRCARWSPVRAGHTIGLAAPGLRELSLEVFVRNRLREPEHERPLAELGTGHLPEALTSEVILEALLDVAVPDRGTDDLDVVNAPFG